MALRGGVDVMRVKEDASVLRERLRWGPDLRFSS